ncbi:MAG: winged helix-turn-helix transcriptional regulator [Gammaproteobacteria bacterium]|nr:winged helix-turn-helix transcriptional regulator [Gammaproteobacteria bacterium]
MEALDRQALQRMQANAKQAEALLKSLGNAKRLMLLCHLLQGELHVSELEERVGLSQSALSQHLARLREQGIVACRKEGTTVYYRIQNPAVMEVLGLLHKLYCS